ncbi:uncharacterized protein LOC133474446 isoform X2 [Phyllopteryx taeniolatus]|uniref:uncharacterized protein LOC133474446 isoform X2 n=1 Tax=Phyllopteryx taeniolatus TaxID=161469 RepID=UPI002AD4755F|nr:uncharacterized protein LOC133474446 isoform X2 [Phyllopteryx taeniolatus]
MLIIEEISVAPKDLFAYVGARLKQIQGTNSPFGGTSVLAVGEVYQLAPVRRRQPWCAYDPTRPDNFEMITWTEITRQKDGVPFAELPNRLRVKGTSDELPERDGARLAAAFALPGPCPKDTPHIYATNKPADSHNSEMLNLLHQGIVTMKEKESFRFPGSPERTAGCSQVLALLRQSVAFLLEEHKPSPRCEKTTSC